MDVDAELGGMAVLLVGESVVVTPLAFGLAQMGVTVGVIDGTAHGTGHDAGSRNGDIRVLGGGVGSREEAIAAMEAAATALGPLNAVAFVPGVPGGLTDRAFADTDEDTWDLEAEAPLRTTLYVLQAAYATMHDAGGSIAMLVPSTALTGAAGLTPFSAAAEGVRALVKSAARAWGADGIRVNTVTLPIQAWGHVPPADHDVPNRYGPSLPDPSIEVDIAGTVAYLASNLSAGLSGGTIGLDRGTVMAP